MTVSVICCLAGTFHKPSKHGEILAGFCSVYSKTRKHSPFWLTDIPQKHTEGPRSLDVGSLFDDFWSFLAFLKSLLRG